VEDWDKAQHRFQAILREKPDHIQAVAKLDEAKRQKHLSALYTQALDAQENENWQAAVETLEKLTSEVADYKDVVSLLRNARRKKQLLDLYEEARRLHKARQWQAVVRVFAQIATLEPNYQDPAGLLSSAEKEVAEIERLDKLNKLYSQGVHEMDAGHWYEARELLEQVHKAQTGFFETERLLRKVENEVVKIKEFDKRNIHINMLYEQAHELVRAKNWRKALDKIEEIQKLDERFVDRDGIFEKVRVELACEEEVVQRQNELAAMYAEAVRILKEGKYQEALDKWNEVRAIDPKYPDRQSLQRTAHKKLVADRPRLRNLKRVGIVSLLAVILVGITWLSSQLLVPLVLSSTLTAPSTLPATKLPTSTLAAPSALPATKLPTPSSPIPLTYWHFSNDSEGWSSFKSNDISWAPFTKGFLIFTTKGPDPYIYSPNNLEISASVTSTISLRMSFKQTNSSKGTIYFITDKDSNFDGKKKQSFPLLYGGTFKYDIDMSGISTWQGVITQLRLDLLDDPAPSSDVQIAIDYIWIH
jgi:outer membrane protein assembly factor BamD (BamD/ComL family)